MKTATSTDLRRRFHRLAAMIDEGETVAVMRRGKHYATLVPCAQDTQPMASRVDIQAQAPAIWGYPQFSASEVAATRAAELEAEQG